MDQAATVLAGRHQAPRLGYDATRGQLKLGLLVLVPGPGCPVINSYVGKLIHSIFHASIHNLVKTKGSLLLPKSCYPRPPTQLLYVSPCKPTPCCPQA